MKFQSNFIIFQPINNDIMCLIYYKKERSIIFLNLEDNKKISEIKNAHKKPITFLRHYLD